MPTIIASAVAQDLFRGLARFDASMRRLSWFNQLGGVQKWAPRFIARSTVHGLRDDNLWFKGYTSEIYDYTLPIFTESQTVAIQARIGRICQNIRQVIESNHRLESVNADIIDVTNALSALHDTLQKFSWCLDEIMANASSRSTGFTASSKTELDALFDRIKQTT